MDPKGSNLASTDLLEISELVSGSYVTKSITGAEIIASVPPTTVDWGDIGGTLSSQTDLNTALNAKQDDITLTTTGTSGASTFVANTLNVPTYSLSGLGGVPTTRTLTINGTTQDLSADRTFTISTGITIGTTAITSGTVGRVLFEGTGNVVQESANLFWDNTNGRLGIGTSSPLTSLAVNSLRATISIKDTTGTTNPSYFGSFDDFLQMAVNRNPSTGVFNNTGKASAQISIEGSTSSGKIFFFATNTNGATPLEAMRINGTGNVLINTTTDAGFKLDVNGTARVTGNIQADSYIKFASCWLRGASGAFLLYDSGLNLKIWMDVAAGTSYFNTGGNYVFGSASANASAQLQIESTTKGFLPPRMTTTQKNAIATPATGLMVYDTTLNVITYYNGTTWI